MAWPNHSQAKQRNRSLASHTRASRKRCTLHAPIENPIPRSNWTRFCASVTTVNRSKVARNAFSTVSVHTVCTCGRKVLLRRRRPGPSSPSVLPLSTPASPIPASLVQLVVLRRRHLRPRIFIAPTSRQNPFSPLHMSRFQLASSSPAHCRATRRDLVKQARRRLVVPPP